MKTYNSYCVETVRVGGEETGLTSWLEARNISMAGFDSLVRGHHQPRLHIPLMSQEFTGQVEEVLEDVEGAVTKLRIRSQTGCVVEADRNCLFVFGQWMGRADLAYCMMSGEF